MKKLLNWKLIDSYTFFGALFLLLLVVIPLILWPEAGDLWISQAKDFVTNTFGVFYLLMGLAALFFLIYIFFSDIGYIKLGEEECEPEFSTPSWGAMLFSSGIGASILYLGSIEWAYYYISPPFNIAPGSAAAVTWASTYGMFHWGLIAWAIYLVPAIPIAYFFYVRKEPILKISVALKPVLGEKHSRSYVGKTIDILFIFGILGGGATSLGLASPLITEGLHKLFGLPMTMMTQVIVLLVTTMIFAYSAYAGLKRGIQFLSNVTIWGAILLLLFVFTVGPTVFILNTSISSVGHMFDNFFSMATWTEPFGGLDQFPQSNFPQDWTIFYWAWWLVFAPTIGLFIARVSKGRTIRNMIAGSITLGALGCAFFFFILGNYGLHLQLSGTLDLVAILQEKGDTAAIYAMLDSLPFSPIVIGLFTILAIIFTATTFDSMSYILAAVVQQNIEDEPLRWNRLFWAFALSFMPITLMFISQITGVNSLSTLQTASVVAGVPLLVIIAMLMISISRVAKVDLEIREEYQSPIINIENLPEVDPWSEQYLYLEKFNALKAKAIEAAENERQLLDEMITLKAKIRDRSLHKFSLRGHNFRISSSEVNQLATLEKALMEAREEKETRSQAAQKARIEFTECCHRKQESSE